MENSTIPQTPVKIKRIGRKNKLIKKYSTITDAGLQYTEGKTDEILNKVQYKFSKTNNILATIISAL